MIVCLHRRLCGPLVALATFACLAQTARALDPQAPLSHFGHQTWRTENGLPQNSVHAVLQTRDGFLWLVLFLLF